MSSTAMAVNDYISIVMSIPGIDDTVTQALDLCFEAFIQFILQLNLQKLMNNSTIKPIFIGVMRIELKRR